MPPPRLHLTPALRLIALLIFAACLLTMPTSSLAQTGDTSSDVIRGLQQSNIYISPGSVAQVTEEASNPKSTLESIVNDNKKGGYTPRVAIVDSVNRVTGGRYKDATNYADYLQNYLGLGNNPLVIVDSSAGVVAARTGKLSLEEIKQITDASRSTFTSQGYLAGARKVTTDIVNKIVKDDESGRLTTTIVIAIVVIGLLLAGLWVANNLNQKWAQRLVKARELSERLTAQVLEVGDKLPFIRVQNGTAADQIQNFLTPGNKSLNSANEQLGDLKKPGFIPLLLQYGKLDSQLTDVENKLEDADANIKQSQQLFDANWSAKDDDTRETARASSRDRY